MPDIRQLRRFIAIANEKSFRRAAARLHVSQPPLSHSIHKLEDEIGTPLFVRDRRHVELTKAGVVFLERAKPTEVYEPICNKAEQSMLFAEYTSAFELLEREDASAKKAFAALAKKYPNDGLAQFHLSRLKSGQTGATIELQQK